MSIQSTMYTGAAGLGSHADAMGVIADNIANVNTVGFRASRANFSDVLGGIVAGDNIGAGSRIGSVQTMFSQGSLLGTGNASDLAISGDGFFVVEGAVNGIEGQYYSRAGQFRIDGDGFLVNADNLRVQGYGIDAGGTISASLDDLHLDAGTLPPIATTAISVDANLDATQAIDPTPFDINDPGGTSDWSTSLTTYDSLGVAHQVTMFFKKTADVPAQQWDVHVAVPGSEIDPAIAQDFAEVGTGTLDFDAVGSLAANSLGPINVQWAGAALAPLTVDLGDPTGTGGTGLGGITNYSGASASHFLDQDGSGSGELTGFEVQPDGTITGRYTTGESRSLGQLATATFSNVESLARTGNGLFATSLASQAPMIGGPGAAGRGSIVAGSLESSNVDLAQEFVTMIAVQRGFQANSRTITTADDMLTEIVSLKR
ncbi:MAG: flagellar hook protein FlgE [Deltaproteobacteria bacterium]|nr:flagellar hook protein FlgE [Nannocystaceae bacterium]